ncbi:MAG TPA: enoyl-CoA hydratase-related protein, partial [Thermoanaerobaculia bacterium]|nr:enoyl-CoA hydratase-related protein [Thermoanaerobaculia bacterium]
HLFLEEAFAAIRRCPVPLVAAVNGAAIGGGCELMLACDLTVAAETATFSHPEVRRGIIPGCGATWTLPRVIGVPRAKEMILTGRTVAAAEALGWGLVNRVVPEPEVLPAARALAEAIASNGPVAVRNARRALDEGLGLAQEDGVACELDAYRRTLASEDRREGIDAFNEKRPPRFRNR